MSGFEYDSTRQDPRFQAIMKTAEQVKNSCDKANCLRCQYRRTGEMLVVCFCEKLADELILRGIVK